jgi:DNA-binding MarR family transcriptional regulator
MNAYTNTIPGDAHGGGLGFLITQARNRLLAAIENELAPLDVTAAQFIVVLAVAHGRASTPSAFASLVGCDSGAMTRLLDRIEGKGILRRRRDIADRRIVQVELTKRGEALHPLIMASVARVHARMLQPFSAAERSQFASLLQRFIDAGDEKFFTPLPAQADTSNGENP